MQNANNDKNCIEMKKLVALILLTFSIITNASPQSCLPDGILFTSQSQIDNFQINYPECTKIEGAVRIESYNITNLNGLSTVNSLGSSLFIHGNKNLKNLSGLENLDSICEWLSISFGVEGYGNLSLQNIHGLQGLNYVGKGIHIGQNDSLIDLSGLENIDSANIEVVITENDRLISLKGLDSLNHIEGDLIIAHNNSLSSLTNLSSLTSIQGRFNVSYNDVLCSLEGLENIDAESITELWLMGNDSLTYCEISSVCNYLADTNNTVAGIWENSVGCNSRIEVENACLVGYSTVNDYEISIYPNPTKEKLSIQSKSNHILNKISIYNMFGVLLKNYETANYEIDVSTLSGGTYIIDIGTNKGKIRKMFIKK